MNFLELAGKRASIRAYKPEPVPDDLLNKVLEAGRIAPSAANFQPWHFVVIRDDAAKARLAEAYAKDWFWKAPVIVVVCVDTVKAWTRRDGKSYAFVDGAIAMDHMTLCAAELGLGTCWIGAFDPEKARAILGVPERVEIVAMTPLGFPDSAPFPKKRKEMNEIVHHDRW